MRKIAILLSALCYGRAKKPNIVEMTPQEYIANEELKVYLKDDNYEIEVVSPNSVTPTDVPPDQPKRKFLVTVSSEDDEDSESEAEPSASAAKSLPGSSVHNKVPDISSDENESETETNSDKDELIEGISKIIKYVGLPASSQIDLRSVSSEILNFVMNMCSVKKLETVNQSAKETQTVDYTPPETVPTSSRNDGVEITNTATQTIFTGEVIGNNIFTQ